MSATNQKAMVPVSPRSVNLAPNLLHPQCRLLLIGEERSSTKMNHPKKAAYNIQQP